MERDSSLNTQTKGGEFAMELPLVSDFLTTVRLATGGVCALSGLEQGGNAKEAGSADDEISFALLSALVAENNVTRNGETVTAITFYA